MGPSEICKWAYLEVGLFFGFPDNNKRLLCDDRAILTGGGDWRDGNDSDASEESDEVHSTEPMKLQLNILFAYPLKQQMLLFAYVSLSLTMYLQ